MCVYHIEVQGNKVILTGHTGQKNCFLAKLLIYSEKPPSLNLCNKYSLMSG